MKEKTKNLFLWTAVLAFIAFSGVIAWLSRWASEEKARAEVAEMQLENTYENALYESLDAVSAMESNFARLLVSNDVSQNVAIATDLYRDASRASEVVGRLPVDTYKHAPLQKFLNQTGDFMSSYIKAVASGANLENYSVHFDDLYAVTSEVRQTLERATERLGEGYAVIADLKIGVDIDVSGEDMQMEYPKMIYDGPFSDARDNAWCGTENLAEISEEQALVIARGIGMTNCSVAGISSSENAVYEVLGKYYGNEAFACLTVKGGVISSFNTAGGNSGNALTEDKLTEKAKDYALAFGYCSDLTPVWHLSSDGITVVNFAPEVDGVIYYPDLVKVKLSKSGALLGVEALGYCANHVERTFGGAMMSEASARTCVSPRLSIKSVRLAVVPKGNGERFCYEVAGSYNGLDYFVYVDARDGKQVDVLRVINDEQGTLVV